MSPADATYARLLSQVTAAIRGSVGDLNAALPGTGRSVAVVLADVLKLIRPALPIECETCRERLVIASTHRRGGVVVQYVQCACQRRKRLLPACIVPRRATRKRAG